MRRPKHPSRQPHQETPENLSEIDPVVSAPDGSARAPRAIPEAPRRARTARSKTRAPLPDAPPADSLEGPPDDEPDPSTLEAPGQATLEHGKGTSRIPSNRRQALRRIVTALAQAGMTVEEIVEHAVQQYPGATPEQARATYYQQINDWHTEFEEEQPKLKATQIQRIRKALVRLYSGSNPNWAAIVKMEDLFARLAGTFEPERVKVDVGAEVKRSVLAVVATLSESEQEAMIQEQLALEARAGSFPSPSPRDREDVAAE